MRINAFQLCARHATITNSEGVVGRSPSLLYILFLMMHSVAQNVQERIKALTARYAITNSEWSQADRVRLHELQREERNLQVQNCVIIVHFVYHYTFCFI